ncbi:xin actin-binding repeat-containing protein 1 isoform X2 [Denticeps clupeoides]|uniref:xin actin-binding repeat-containing protein 1 isoform X2 n=1 Tax=Denticeps clupeoides TaxID=299321 RepID=UPI0010A4EE25|nr:xin actin-binding repeat-containing protein 1-like isoform X2 [Denticeps clupeoides]
MEVKGILRRTQSLRNVSSDSKLSISDAGLRDRQKSVSQLVAEYRFSVKRKPVDSGQEKQEPTPLIIYTPPIDKKAIKPAPPVEKNDIQSRPGLPDEVRPLQRSRSMNSLPRWGSVSTNALRELFESKVTTPKVLRHKSMTPKTPAENGNVRVFDDGKKDSEEHTDKEKVLKGTEKAVKSRHLERQTSTGAFDLGRTSEELCNNEKHTPAAGSGDSDIFYGWDKSAISVKALSALYLSKVAAFGSSIKPAQYSGVPGSKATKMAEEAQSQQRQISERNLKDDLPHRAEIQTLHLTPSPSSQEAITTLYLQRQKCELKRLLKHTCPELKTLDRVVDLELAEILEPEITAVDIGYQGEVQSRRWIFENCALKHMQEDPGNEAHLLERGDLVEESRRARSLQERSVESVYKKQGPANTNQLMTFLSMSSEVSTKGSMYENSVDENIIGGIAKSRQKRIKKESRDVLKKGFEGKPQFKDGISDSVIQALDDISKDKTSVTQAQEHVAERKILETSICGSGGGNFSAENPKHEIGHECSKVKSGKNVNSPNHNATQDKMQTANVKDRAHLFESTPIDQINLIEGSKAADDSVQTNLTSLYCFSVIHSSGTVIEEKEAGNIGIATYNLSPGQHPNIHHEEVVTGNVKNIMLRLLPRGTLKPQVTFLKEDSEGNVDIKQIDVPIHQLSFTERQEKAYWTASLVQITEDLLNQEESVRKGVVIQGSSQRCNEVMVYSLYEHEEKAQTGPLKQEEKNIDDCSKDNVVHEVRKERMVSTSSWPSATRQQNEVPCLFHLEDCERGKVKLFKSFMEKGEREYLKTLKETVSDGDLTSTPAEVANNNAASTGESLLDVESPQTQEGLKNTLDSASTQTLTQNSVVKAHECVEHGNLNDGPPKRSQGATEVHKQKEIHKTTTDEGTVFQAELVDVVDDEISDLQMAILSLQLATIEAKALQHRIQERQEAKSNVGNSNGQEKPLQTERPKEDSMYVVLQKEAYSPMKSQASGRVDEDRQESSPSKMNSFDSSDSHHTLENSETPTEGHIQTTHMHLQNTTEVFSSMTEKDQGQRGNFQAALNSLGKSSFNVTKGDFKAAMIYRNAGKSYEQRRKKRDLEAVSKQNDALADLPDETKLAATSSVPEGEQVTAEGLNKATATVTCLSRPTNQPTSSAAANQHPTSSQNPIRKDRKPRGPKPALPPKPAFLRKSLEPNQGQELPSCKGAECKYMNSTGEESEPDHHMLVDTLGHHTYNIIHSTEVISAASQVQKNSTGTCCNSFEKSSDSAEDVSAELHKPGSSIVKTKPVKPKRMGKLKDGGSSQCSTKSHVPLCSTLQDVNIQKDHCDERANK